MPETINAKSQRVSPYQVFMLALCLWAILSLAGDTVWNIPAETQRVLDYADNALCGLFFLDFLYNLYSAPKRWAYLASWGWIDLLSSIPTIDALRWGRAARVVRVLRVLRGVKSARAIAHFLVARRAQNGGRPAATATATANRTRFSVSASFPGPLFDKARNKTTVAQIPAY
jgi:voltage-gated potassium channel